MLLLLTLGNSKYDLEDPAVAERWYYFRENRLKSHVHRFAPLYTDDYVLTSLVFYLLMKESELEVNVFRLCGVGPISEDKS
jgi:hypothetical protein